MGGCRCLNRSLGIGKPPPWPQLLSTFTGISETSLIFFFAAFTKVLSYPPFSPYQAWNFAKFHAADEPFGKSVIYFVLKHENPSFGDDIHRSKREKSQADTAKFYLFNNAPPYNDLYLVTKPTP